MAAVAVVVMVAPQAKDADMGAPEVAAAAKVVVAHTDQQVMDQLEPSKPPSTGARMIIFLDARM